MQFSLASAPALIRGKAASFCARAAPPCPAPTRATSPAPAPPHRPPAQLEARDVQAEAPGRAGRGPWDDGPAGTTGSLKFRIVDVETGKDLKALDTGVTDYPKEVPEEPGA